MKRQLAPTPAARNSHAGSLEVRVDGQPTIGQCPTFGHGQRREPGSSTLATDRVLQVLETSDAVRARDEVRTHTVPGLVKTNIANVEAKVMSPGRPSSRWVRW
jgi:hypothetical protein